MSVLHCIFVAFWIKKHVLGRIEPKMWILVRSIIYCFVPSRLELMPSCKSRAILWLIPSSHGQHTKTWNRSHVHTSGQFRIIHSAIPQRPVFGVWKDSGVAGGNPRRNGGNMQPLSSREIYTRNFLQCASHRASRRFSYVFFPHKFTKMYLWFVF